MMNSLAGDGSLSQDLSHNPQTTSSSSNPNNEQNNHNIVMPKQHYQQQRQAYHLSDDMSVEWHNLFDPTVATPSHGNQNRPDDWASIGESILTGSNVGIGEDGFDPREMKKKVSDAQVYGPRFCVLFETYCRKHNITIDIHRHLMSLCLEHLVPFIKWARESDNQVQWIQSTLLENDYLRPEVRNGVVMVIIYTFASIKATLDPNLDMFITLQDNDQGLGIANKFSLKIYNDPFFYLIFLKQSISALIDAGALPDNERQNQPKRNKIPYQNREELLAFQRIQRMILDALDSGNINTAKTIVSDVANFWQQRGKFVRNRRFAAALQYLSQPRTTNALVNPMGPPPPPPSSSMAILDFPYSASASTSSGGNITANGNTASGVAITSGTSALDVVNISPQEALGLISSSHQKQQNQSQSVRDNASEAVSSHDIGSRQSDNGKSNSVTAGVSEHAGNFPPIPHGTKRQLSATLLPRNSSGEYSAPPLQSSDDDDENELYGLNPVQDDLHPPKRRAGVSSSSTPYYMQQSSSHHVASQQSIHIASAATAQQPPSSLLFHSSKMSQIQSPRFTSLSTHPYTSSDMGLVPPSYHDPNSRPLVWSIPAIRFERVGYDRWLIKETRIFDIPSFIRTVINHQQSQHTKNGAQQVQAAPLSLGCIMLLDETLLRSELISPNKELVRKNSHVFGSGSALEQELTVRQALMTSWPLDEIAQFIAFIKAYQQHCRYVHHRQYQNKAKSANTKQPSSIPGNQQQQEMQDSEDDDNDDEEDEEQEEVSTDNGFPTLWEYWTQQSGRELMQDSTINNNKPGSATMGHTHSDKNNKKQSYKELNFMDNSKENMQTRPPWGYLAYEAPVQVTILIRAQSFLEIEEDLWCTMYPYDFTTLLAEPRSQDATFGVLMSELFPQLLSATTSAISSGRTITMRYFAHAVVNSAVSENLVEDKLNSRLPEKAPSSQYQTIGTWTHPANRLLARMAPGPVIHDFILECNSSVSDSSKVGVSSSL